MSVDYVLRLVDRMSGPANGIADRLDRVEKKLDRLQATLNRSGRGFTGMGNDGSRAADRITAAVERTNASLERSHVRARRVGLALAALATAAPIAGLLAVGKAALGGAGAREGQLLSLGTLLKTNNQARVKSAAGWIAQFADLTPFQDNDVNAAVKQLLASKFTFGQVQGLGRITGNAASALGADPGDAAQKWEAINRALGQIKSKGVLQGDELLQLQEAGIGTNAYLVKAFGPNYRKLQEAGKISGTAAINAIVAGLNTDYAGAMERQSRTFLGLISTIQSRPQRLFANLFDAGGLEDARRFMANIVNLTDFSKPPGSRIQQWLVKSMAQLSKAIFGPLADATQGEKAVGLVNRLMDGIDRFSVWWEHAGPKVMDFARGVGSGLMFLWRVAEVVLRPIRMVLKSLGLLGTEGGDNLARILGYVIGAAVGFRLLGMAMGLMLGPIPGIFRLLAGLTLLNAALPMLAANGVLSAVWLARLQRVMAFLLPTTRVFTVLMGGWRGILYGAWLGLRGMASTWVAANGGAALLASQWLKVFGVVGLVIAAVVALKTAGDNLYLHFKPFADLIDSLRDNPIVKLFTEKAENATGFNRILHHDLAIDAQNGWNKLGTYFGGTLDQKQQVYEQGDANFTSGMMALAKRQGLNPLDLLKVMNQESGVSPTAIHKNAQGQITAGGLIQFQAATAAELGTSIGALTRMSRAEQLPYVEKYLAMHGVKPGMGLEQLYMAVLSGGAGNTGTLYSANDPNTSAAYKGNIGLDVNKDGKITSTEATAQVESSWKRDAPTIINQITVAAGTDPKAVGDAAHAGTTRALTQFGLELGGAAP